MYSSTAPLLLSLSLPLYPISNHAWQSIWKWSLLYCKYWAKFLGKRKSFINTTPLCAWWILNIHYKNAYTHYILTEKNPPLFSFGSLTGWKSLTVLLCLKVGEEVGEVDGEEAWRCGGLGDGGVNWSSASPSISSSSSPYRNKQIIMMVLQ